MTLEAFADKVAGLTLGPIMAHPYQLQFINALARHVCDDFKSVAILEVGSHDVNGTIRGFFPNSSYVGMIFLRGLGWTLWPMGIFWIVLMIV